MNNSDLERKSNQQLKTALDMTKTITVSLPIVLTLLMAVTIYGFIVKEEKATFIALFAVAIACSGILPLQFSSLKKIKAEIKSRGNSSQKD